MPETVDFGKHLFLHPIRLQPGTARFHIAPTNEVNHPYRTSKSLVVRLRGSYGLVFGWWRKTERTDDEALLSALQLVYDPDTLPEIEVSDADHWRQRSISEYRPPLTEDVAQEVIQAAKRKVAEHSMDADEEHQFLQMLGF